MKFKIGDRVIVIKNGKDTFLKHFLNLGSEVTISGFFKGWKGINAYYVKGYSEPLLEEELEKIINISE